jgi:hypothetical protein
MIFFGSRVGVTGGGWPLASLASAEAEPKAYMAGSRLSTGEARLTPAAASGTRRSLSDGNDERRASTRG